MAQNNDNLSIARTLAASVKTLLGPQHSLKCCTTDDEAVICSSTAKLLQFIDIQHPAGFIINDACQGQYKKYRTNCTTLVCLAGFWSSAVQELQDQGVPVPIIVRLMDDALEVCEEVCHELSIPITEALQSHHLAYPPAKRDEEAFVDKVSNSTVDSFHGSDSIMLHKMEKSDINDGDDDNDISWYFDGQVPGVDGQTPGIDSHIPGIHGQILGAHDQILRVDNQIFGGVGHIPGVQDHITGTDSNMSGAINMELMKNSYFATEVPGSDILEITSSDKDISRDSNATSNNESPRNSLSGSGNSKFEVDTWDTKVTVPSKTFFSVEQKDKDFTFNSANEGGHYSKSSLESLESKCETFSSTKKDERDDDDDDEFEASFQEAISSFAQNVVSDSANKDPGGKIAEISIEKERKEIYPTRIGTKGFADTCQKANCAKLENTSNDTKTKLVNRTSLSSSSCNEKEATDKLLSLLSEKLESKNKSVGRQMKMSEIFKGSRHFTNSAANKPMPEMTPASSVNQGRDSTFSEERYRKSETCSTSKTSTQLILETSQTRKPDLASSKSCKSKTGQESIVEQNQDSFVRKKTEDLKLIERNRELLSHLGSRLSHDSNSPLQTVLLCNPCKDVLCDMEERFWNSIHRLKNALSCGQVLPGAGEVEVACIRRLNELAEEQSKAKESVYPLSGWLQESLEMFRPLVYTAVAQGFREFLGSVLQNSGKCNTLCGAFAYVEKLVKSGCSLNILECFNVENSEDSLLNELQNTEEISRHNARGHVSDNPASDPSGSPLDPAHLKRFPSDVDSVVWDDYTAKKEAWRRAVGIVRILLQSDMLVQTGLGRNDNEAVLF